MSHTILLVDDDEETRKIYSKILSREGFKVVQASSPEEARQQLRSTEIDLAVIDIRLEDDSDSNDQSGLDLVLEDGYPPIPTILWTGFEQQNIRKVVETRLMGEDGLPRAQKIVIKGNPDELVTAVKDLFELWPRLKTRLLKVNELLNKDQNEARKQAKLLFIMSVAAIIIGTVLILLGLGSIFFTQSVGAYVSLVTAVGGVVVNVISVLYFTRIDKANKRMDTYHKELLQSYWMESLIAYAESLPAAKEHQTKQEIILQAARNWFGSARSD